MSVTVSFDELDGQYAELLPARTVLSLFSVHDTAGASPGEPAPGQGARVLLSTLGLGGTGNAGSDGTASSGAEG